MKEIEVGNYYKINSSMEGIPDINSIILITKEYTDKKNIERLAYNLLNTTKVFEYDIIEGNNERGDQNFSLESNRAIMYLDLYHKPIPNESDLLIEQSKKLYNL